MGKVFVLLSLFAFSLANSKSADPRGLSLFNVVKFPNSECQAKSDAALTGTCFSETECSDKNGVKDGNCAQGFGACCIFQVNTGAGSVTYNNSYIENPGYPQKFLSTETSPCAYTVKRMQSNICQVRLDFTDLELSAPGTTNGDCATDSLVIAPGATNTLAPSKPPTLCGTSTGQHVYVDAGTAETGGLKFHRSNAAVNTNLQMAVFNISWVPEIPLHPLISMEHLLVLHTAIFKTKTTIFALSKKKECVEWNTLKTVLRPMLSSLMLIMLQLPYSKQQTVPIQVFKFP